VTMNHLTSVLRFDLSNVAFTGTLTSVNFAYTASSGSSLLPASGSFTLSNTGTVTTGTLTDATSWTVSNVATSSGTAPVYLMTFPDQRSGTLTITATDSNGNDYYRKITLSDFSLTSGSIKAYKVTLNPITTYSLKYYQWDATGEYPAAYSTSKSAAVNSCKDCPTYDQIEMYIGAGVYWDSTTPWKDASSGTVYTGGIWLKKKAYISGFDAGTATKGGPVIPTEGVPTDTSEYFFLPAGGGTFFDGAVSVGSCGYYWSSAPVSGIDYTDYAYSLEFFRDNVYLYGNDNCVAGLCLWRVQ